MKSRFQLIALTAMMFSLLGVVTGAWGDCAPLTISPSSAIIPAGGTVQFTVDCGSAEYTWEISASDCTSEGTIDEDGTYTAPDAGGCTETVRVTDTANGFLIAEATVKVCGEIAVSIAYNNYDIGCGECTTLIAKTTCDGTEIPGCYSWELDGEEVSTSYLFTFCPLESGCSNIKVTDTCSGESAVSEFCIGCCRIDVVQEQVARSRWIPLPAILTIGCLGDEKCDFNALTRVNCEGDSLLDVIPAGKLVFPNTQTIQQLVLIFPAILTGGFGEECETMTCSVTNGGTCEDIATFDICLLPFPLDLQR